MQIKGPENMYVGTQGFTYLTGARVGKDQLALINYGVSSLAGQRHSHVHIQRGDNYDTRQLNFRVSFLERTPGSMARASLTAIAAAVVIVIMALVQLHSMAEACASLPVCGSDATARASSDSGLLQILLALPLALTTASLGQSVSFWGGVLAARIANVATLVFCFAAIGISALPERFTTNGLERAWLVVTTGIVLTAIICICSWVWRANAHGAYVMAQKGEV